MPKLYPRADPRLLAEIPEELRAVPQWDCWKLVDGAKIPVDPRTGRAYPRGLRSDDMSTATFEEARTFFEKNALASGLGFRFKSRDPFLGVDLDDVRNPETGEVLAWAKDLVARFATYTEISPSGTGLHIISRARLPRAVTKTIVNACGVEMYFDGRYFTITGNQLEGTPRKIADAQIQADYLYEFLTGSEGGVPGLEEFDEKDLAMPRAAGIALPVGTDFERLLVERGWRFRKAVERDGSTSYAYHGLGGQPCLIQGTVHEAQARNARQARFVVKDGYVFHQCFDSDCQAVEEPKTRRALRKIGFGALLEASLDLEDVFRRDVANAALFAKMHAGNVVYVADQRLWYAWDGRRFLANNLGEVYRRARATIKHLYEEAINEPEKERRKAKLAWAVASEGRVERIVKYAESESALEAFRFSEAFDRDDYLFNCANGVLNLKTGELTPHNQRYRITRLSPVAYDPRARCPEFEIWLALTCGGDRELAEYLMRFVGYSASGLTTEQCFWLFYGPTKTGKSTFIRLVRGLLGDYSSTLPEGAVLVSSTSNPEHALAELAGTRLATLVELRAGVRYDEGKLKQITGQDKIGASKKYLNFFEFESHAKLAMAVNDRPSVRDTGDAFWNRVKPVPFLAFVPPEKRIAELDRKLLEAEGPGILALAVRAFQSYLRDGIREPRAVREAASAYREEQDFILQFIEEKCERDPSERTSFAAIYASFLGWIKENNFRSAMSKVRFGRELTRLGFAISKNGDGDWVREGIKVRDLFSGRKSREE